MTSLRRSAAGAVMCAGVVVLLAFRDGGYDAASWLPATVALLAAAGLGALLGRAPAPTGGEFRFIGGLAAFSAWVALSALWSPDAGTSLDEAQRALLYVAAVAAAVCLRGALVTGALAAIGLVCAYAVGQRVLRGTPDPPDPFEGTLLHEPIGYANGLGALAALGLAAAVVLVRRGRPGVAAGGICALFAVTLALTGSRGAWLAAAVGIAVAVSLALGRRRLAASVAVLAGLVLVLMLSLPAGRLADDAAARGGDRAWYWHVAWEEAAAAPLAGRGAGSFAGAWLERQPVPVSVQDAHSLYLETLAELGVIGLGLLLFALAQPLLAAPRDRAAAAATGAYVAFLFHAGIDWDWELPAVTLAGLFFGAAALQRSLQDSDTSSV